jgi:hypothetical protein
MFAISACDKSGSDELAEWQATSAPTDAMASIALGLNIAANVHADAGSAS